VKLYCASAIQFVLVEVKLHILTSNYSRTCHRIAKGHIGLLDLKLILFKPQKYLNNIDKQPNTGCT